MSSDTGFKREVPLPSRSRTLLVVEKVVLDAVKLAKQWRSKICIALLILKFVEIVTKFYESLTERLTDEALVLSDVTLKM